MHESKLAHVPETTNEAAQQYGVHVVKGALSEQQVANLASDCETLWQWRPDVWGRNGSVANLPLRISWLGNAAFSGLRDTTHMASRFIEDPAISINRQTPNGGQVLHPDCVQSDGPVIVAHASDGGAFDFVGATGELQRLRLNGGDMVRLEDNTLLHRGVNLSDKPRYTIVYLRLNEQMTRKFYWYEMQLKPKLQARFYPDHWQNLLRSSQTSSVRRR